MSYSKVFPPSLFVSEIETLNTQLDQLHNALDSLEEKNDNIKERLVELLEMVKLNRDQLDQVELDLSSDSNNPELSILREQLLSSNNSELSSLREQLSQMEACMTNVMIPRTSDMSTLREQLNQLEVNVTQAAADVANNAVPNPGQEEDH